MLIQNRVSRPILLTLPEPFHYARTQCVIGSKSCFHLKVPLAALLLNQNDPIIDNLSCLKIFLDSLVVFYLEGFYEVPSHISQVQVSGVITIFSE